METQSTNARFLPSKYIQPIRFTVVFFFISMLLSPSSLLQGEKHLSLNQLQQRYGGILSLTSEMLWRYHPGDNLEWAEPGFDDRHWQPVHGGKGIREAVENNWTGSGWFRCRFRIDETLKREFCAIFLRQMGAAEVYLNGKRIHRMGAIKQENGKKTFNRHDNWEIFSFDKSDTQVVAIRYINPSAALHHSLGIDTGFLIYFVKVRRSLPNIFRREMGLTAYKIRLTIIPFVLAIIHIFLFLFYPPMKENLYYSICLVGFAGFFYCVMERFLAADPAVIVFCYRAGPFLNVFTVTFLLLTSYFIVYQKLPRRFFFFAVSAGAVGVWGFFKPIGAINFALFGFSVLVIFECLRAFIKDKPPGKKGIWIILCGVVTLAALSVYQACGVLVDMIAFQYTDPPREFYRLYTYGGAVFIICMSLYLSYQFSRINKNLEARLVEVNELSEKNLQQEREARKQEMEHRLLEADNARKTRELEEARQLQLSMLPETVPNVPGYDIKVFMETAAEVGGDYYDFHVGEDNILTAVIGDATGHGMKAGTMVATIKGLFGTYNESIEIPGFFSKCSEIIKGMHLGNLYMAMLILKINGNKITASSAGMPPALIFRAQTQTVEELLLKAPPLGGFTDFTYRQAETVIDEGDIVLLLSDGFPERFNEDDDMLGMAIVRHAFQEIAKESPDRVIEELNEVSEKWSGGRPQDDDITFMVIKAV